MIQPCPLSQLGNFWSIYVSVLLDGWKCQGYEGWIYTLTNALSASSGRELKNVTGGLGNPFHRVSILNVVSTLVCRGILHAHQPIQADVLCKSF